MVLLQCKNIRSDGRAAVRRAHLLEVARKLFMQHGFHSAGIAQLAAETGIKVGQIYRDFQSKEDIIAAIVEADVAFFLDEQRLCTAVESRDARLVRDWIEDFLACEKLLDRSNLMPEIVAESARNRRIAAIFATVDAKVRAYLSGALAVLAPGPERAGGRAVLGDLIMTLAIGLCNRRIADPTLDLAPLAATIRRLIDRELDALQQAGAADVDRLA